MPTWTRAALSLVLAACADPQENVNATPEAALLGPFQTVEDTPTAPIVLTGADVEDGPEGLTVAIDSQPSAGGLDKSTGPGPLAVIYTPRANFAGTDSFRFTVTDKGGAVSTPSLVTINVSAVNDAPSATPTPRVETEEDTAATAILRGSDPESAAAALTVNVVRLPGHGALDKITGQAPLSVRYTPAANYEGTDSFAFQVSDGATTSAPMNVSVVVSPVNDRPAAIDRAIVATVEDAPTAPIVLEGTDLESATGLTVRVTRAPAYGSLDMTSGEAPLSVIYTPVRDFNGNDWFQFVVGDGLVESPVSTLSITVEPVQDAPVAFGTGVLTDEDVPVRIVLEGTDVDGDPLMVSAILVPPAHGALTDLAGAALALPAPSPLEVRFTPAANYNGVDALLFEVSDGADASSALAAVVVSAVNDAPTMSAIPNQIAAVGYAFSYTPSAADSDATDVLTFARSTAGAALPAWASLDPATGRISGTPNATGTTSGIILEVRDAARATVLSNSFSIEVRVPMAPRIESFTASPGAVSVGGDTTLSWLLSGAAPTGLFVAPLGRDVLGSSQTTVTPFPSAPPAGARQWYRLNATTASAPSELAEVRWAVRGGGSNNQTRILAVAVSPADAIFAAGTFASTATLGEGPSAVTLTGPSSSKFMARYDADGGLVWARRTPGGHSLAAREDGSFLLAGSFEDAATFGEGEAGQTVLTGRNLDAFLAALDGDGRLLWAKRGGGPANDGVEGVAALPDGSAVVAGTFDADATFGEGSSEVTLRRLGTQRDLFLARYRADGGLLWVRRDGGRKNTQALGVSALADGSVVMVGDFTDGATFGAGEAGEATLVDTAEWRQNGFVARYRPDGSLMWAKRVGGSLDSSVRTASFVPDGSLIVAGDASGSATLGFGEPNETTFPAAGSDTGFVARYNADGSLRWARSFGGPSTDGVTRVIALPDGSAVVAGYFYSSAVFGGTTVTSGGAANSDSFVAKYDPAGALLWVKSAGGAAYDIAYAAAVMRDGSVLAAGHFSGTAMFPRSETPQVQLTAPYRDAFLMRILPVNVRYLDVAAAP